MEGSKVKNIVFLILLITNLLLLFLMVSQRLESRQLQEKTLTDTVQLLEAKGIAVQAENLSRITFPTAMTLDRGGEGELERFTALLGEGTTVTQRGVTSQYEGPLGRAETRGDGSFTVTFSPGAYPLQEGQFADTAQEALKRIGFTGNLLNQQEDTLTFLQEIQGVSVFSCQATASCEGDSLSSISGVRLMGNATASAGSAPLNTATLLLRFRGTIIDSGDACTAILSAQPGYLLSTSTTGKSQLIPVLRLETDTGLYYLSALSGESVSP